MNLPKSEKRDHNDKMVYVLYFAAFSSGVSIAGSNGAMGFMFLFFVSDLIRERSFKGLSFDSNWFMAMYGWKGITALANGAWGGVYATKEIWDKLPYVMIGKYKYNEKVVNTVFHTMFASNSVVIVYALLQKYLDVPWFFQSLFMGNRMIGYFGNPLHYGGFISFVVLACFSLIFFYDKKYVWYMPFLLVGLALSGCKSYFFGVIVGLSVLAFLKSRKTFIITMVSTPMMIVVFAILSPDFFYRIEDMFHTQSYGVRFQYWSIAWDTFLANPFFGVGYEQFTYVLEPYFYAKIIPHPAHAHNLYMEEFAEGGLVGGLLMISLTGYFIYKYYRGFRLNENADPLMRSLYAGLLGAFLSLAVGGMGEYNFGTAVVWIQLTFMMGLAEGYRKMILAEQ